MGIEREEYHHRMCDVHNRHSEWKARCSSCGVPGTIATICRSHLLTVACAHARHLRRISPALAMIGAQGSGWSNDLLAVISSWRDRPSW